MTGRQIRADKDEEARSEMGTHRGTEEETREKERHKLYLRLQNVKASAALKVQLTLTRRLKHAQLLKGKARAANRGLSEHLDYLVVVFSAL